MNDKVYSFKLGTLDCAVLFDGSRNLTLKTMFPAVPDEELKRRISETNNKQELPTGFNVLYLKLDDKHCLIDAGLGSGELGESLTSLGVAPEAIDTIIITHNDGDHIGGLGQFSNAEIILTQHAWELWTNESSRQGMIEEFIKLFRDKISPEELEQRATSRERHGAETLPSLQDRVRLVEADVEVLPGVKLIYAPGHRTDHYAVQINSGGETLIHVVDSIRHPLQANHKWASFIDTDPPILFLSPLKISSSFFSL